MEKDNKGKDKDTDPKPKTPESSEATAAGPPASFTPSPEAVKPATMPKTDVQPATTSAPSTSTSTTTIVTATTTTTANSSDGSATTATTSGASTSTSTVTSTSSSTSSTSSGRPQRTPSPPKKPAVVVSSTSTSASHQPDETKAPSPKSRSTSAESSKDSVSASQDDDKVKDSASTSEPASSKSQKEDDKVVDQDQDRQKPNKDTTTTTVTAAAAASSTTTKRPATDAPAQAASETATASADAVDNTDDSSAAGGNDAKRRKIRRDFKFENRDPSSAATPTDTPPNRIAFSVTRGVVKTSVSSSKVGKPTPTAAAAKNDSEKAPDAATPTPSAAAQPEVATTESTPATTEIACETPMEIDIPEAKDTKPVTGAGKITPPSSSAEEKETTDAADKDKEKSKEPPSSGEAGGPKVPPIKIVLGSNGSNSGAPEGHTGDSSCTTTKEGGSPNSLFPYVVSSTTPDTTSTPAPAPAAVPAPMAVTSGDNAQLPATVAITITTWPSTLVTTTIAKGEATKKDPGHKIKLIATLGPTGGTLTYAKCTSMPASSTTSTTTSSHTSKITSIVSSAAAAPPIAKTELSTNTTTSESSKDLKPSVSISAVAVEESMSSIIDTVSTTETSLPTTADAANDSAKPEAISIKDEPAPSPPAAVAASNNLESNDVGKAKAAVKSEPAPGISEPAAPIARGRESREKSRSRSKSNSPAPSPSSVSVSAASKEKEKEDAATAATVAVAEKERVHKGASPPIVSSTTITVPTPTTTSVAATTGSTTTTATASTMSSSSTTSAASAAENLPREKPHRVTRSSHRIAASTGAGATTSANAAGNGQAPGSPATGSPKMSASASPGQPEAAGATPMETVPPANAPVTAAAKGEEKVEKTDSTDSTHVDIHPRKRKIRSKEPTPTGTGGATSSSNSSTSGETNEATAAANATNNQSTDPPVLNCFEMYQKIRRQIEARRKNLFPVQPKPPQGFKDYLMNRATYVLQGNPNAHLAVPLLNAPANVAPQMKDIFVEQEKERHKLRLQHLVEKEKLVLCVEQEILRVHGRAARSLSNQALPFSVCTILKDQEVYNLLTPEQEEKEKNARSRYNGRLFLSWLQDVDDKWDKIKESMLLRHHNEAESLAAVQRMNWEWKLKEYNLCEPKTRPKIEDLHVPMVHVSDDFDLLPA